MTGEDIWLDVDPEHGPDRTVAGDGDWLLVSGAAALRQSLIRRFLTAPGDWATNPGYGAGLRLFVKERNTQASRADLEARVRAQALKDSRVEKVSAVRITWTGVLLRIEVDIVAKLELQRALPLTVALQVGA